ncbi:phosphate/phosphite/phosphonate ABC transporter substrate-binding protein [Methylopila henanensis]|uniref:Phosphate/phosphite/phosphonate ABC transporter substrate-binding protein n=1 Tax=Methylopila henanensis TaxID=873516 RepID=A0ABW4K5U6_9HYPH
MMLASLPMYSGPEGAASAFWAAIRDGLRSRGIEGAPATLGDPADLSAHWRSPALLFSQTCGLPFSTELAGCVTLLAVPHYDAPGCEGPNYRSVIVARADDAADTLAGVVGRRAAVNAVGSHSGFSQLVTTLAPFARGAYPLSEMMVSGSHRASLSLVREGVADLAAIDCVTWALLVSNEPRAVSELKIVGRSPPSLGLPFVASSELPSQTIEALRSALADVMRHSAHEATRRALMLNGMSTPTQDAYAAHAESARFALSFMGHDAGPDDDLPVAAAFSSPS